MTQVVDKTVNKHTQRITTPAHNRATLAQLCRAFQSKLEAAYPDRPAEIAIACAAYLIVTRYFRRRMQHCKEGKAEQPRCLKASRQLSEAIAIMRGRESAPNAPVNPRDGFEASLRELEARRKSPTPLQAALEPKSSSVNAETSSPAGERPAETISANA